MTTSYGFIGVGKVGSAFGIRLAERGYQVVACRDIKPEEAARFAGAVSGCHIMPTAQSLADECDFVFITTPDDIIAEVAAAVRWRSRQTVVHCSGANTVDVLEAVKHAGGGVGAIHPLNTFASLAQSLENLVGGHFTLEAEEPVLSTLKKMATDLEGDYATLPAASKPLYHAAGAFSCNYLYTLVDIATRLWQHFGIDQAEATEACLPILSGTLKNIEHVGFPGCLTGPIARGDIGTIEKHLMALETHEPSIVPLYKALGRATIPIALAKGTLSQDRAEGLNGLLAAE